jgi:hypothetical protein
MKLELLYPNKDWENICFLGIDFFYHKENNKRRKFNYSSIYLLFDIFWYKMGIEVRFNIKKN